ncbi:hypothetical protein [Staphylococcus hominis]|uniref:hypothetical protein n=1 Tax=Staphylococcus hominis TaxID=1290 RepID=UPI003DA03731
MKQNSRITLDELNKITMGTSEVRKGKGGGFSTVTVVTPIVPTSKCASIVKPCNK